VAVANAVVELCILRGGNVKYCNNMHSYSQLVLLLCGCC
jgi:hypothetical protein